MKLTNITTALAQAQPEVLEQLRPLETRLGYVFTLFKSSVYAFLSQEQARAEELEKESERKAQGQARR